MKEENKTKEVLENGIKLAILINYENTNGTDYLIYYKNNFYEVGRKVIKKLSTYKEIENRIRRNLYIDKDKYEYYIKPLKEQYELELQAKEKEKNKKKAKQEEKRLKAIEESIKHKYFEQEVCEEGIPLAKMDTGLYGKTLYYYKGKFYLSDGYNSIYELKTLSEINNCLKQIYYLDEENFNKFIAPLKNNEFQIAIETYKKLLLQISKYEEDILKVDKTFNINRYKKIIQEYDYYELEQEIDLYEQELKNINKLSDFIISPAEKNKIKPKLERHLTYLKNISSLLTAKEYLDENNIEINNKPKQYKKGRK